MRHIVLTQNEMKKLTFIRKQGKTSLERNRSMCLPLSNQGYSMSKVAEIMKINRMTVKRLLDAWENVIPCKRFESLYRVEGQGAKSKLEPVRDKIPQFNIETPMKIHFTDGIILTNLSYHTNFWQKKRPIKCIGLTGLEQHAKPNKIS